MTYDVLGLCTHILCIYHGLHKSESSIFYFIYFANRYNDRNGPGSYFANFTYAFDEEEVEFLRHGNSSNVEPGKSPWQQSDTPRDNIPDLDDDEKAAQKLKLDAFPVKESYNQLEIVTVEIRLKNIHNRPL